MNKKSTCDDKYRIDAKFGFDEPKCKKLCTEEDKCSFCFIATNGWCVLYEKCDERRIPGVSGSTFKKKTGNINCLELK